jgi:uncharacterized protein (TIRG00374 family)
MNAKRIFKWIFVLLPFAVVIAIGLLDWDAVKGIGKAFGRLNLFFVFSGVLCMIVFWMLDGYILHYITASMYPKRKYLFSLRIAILGQYYSAITPFASGGQPAQVLYMKKYGMPVGISTSVVTVKFLTFQAGVCIFYIISMLLRFEFFYKDYTGIFWLSLAGFAINFGVIFFLLLAMFKGHFVSSAAEKIVGFLSRIRLVKNREKWLKTTAKTVSDFQKSIVFLKSHPFKIAVILLLNVLHLVFLFSIGYFVCLSFGINPKYIAEMIMLQSFLYITVSYFPIPGGSGANEAGFFLFFQRFFAQQYIYLGMILWRLITYYLTLAVGLLLTLFEGIFGPKGDKDEQH